MTFEKKIFPIYAMSYISFCKEVLNPVLTGVVVGALCRLFVEELQKIRARKQLVKLVRELQEALQKDIEEEKVMELAQTLEALEKEIKASQNEKLLRLHEALVKNINALPNFELKNKSFDIPCLLTTSLCKQSLMHRFLPALLPALAGLRKRL